MDRIYVFIIRNDVWIYILCALTLLWYVSEYVRSRSLLRRAMFGLERETGSRIRNNSLFFIVLSLSIVTTVYYVNEEVAPQLAPELLRPPTPTPDIFSTPLNTPTQPITLDASPTPELAPTITLPAGAALPAPAPAVSDDGETPLLEDNGAPPTPVVGCTLELNISEPRNGAVVAGIVSFSGTADGRTLSAYRLEANGPQTNGQWALLLDGAVPVRDGPLGNVNLSQWSSGPYLIRLTAIDSGANDVGYCIAQVTLDNS